jgi:hypothetical protein
MFICIPRQSLMMRQSSPWVSVRLDEECSSSIPCDSQEIARLDEDSQCSSLVDDRISPAPPAQVLALIWQCDMWSHVAYGV